MKKSIIVALTLLLGSSAFGQKNKMTICHHPPGNPTNTQTIEISVSAWAAHQAHGDTQGACQTDTVQTTNTGTGVVNTTGTTTPTSTSTTSGSSTSSNSTSNGTVTLPGSTTTSGTGTVNTSGTTTTTTTTGTTGSGTTTTTTDTTTVTIPGSGTSNRTGGGSNDQLKKKDGEEKPKSPRKRRKIKGRRGG